MYSHEIENLLRIRNYLISNEEYFNVCKTSPQINLVEYSPYNDQFHISTKDNFNFIFKVYKKEKRP